MDIDTNNSLDQERITALVSRVFSIETITWGRPEERYVVRYRGQLKMDSTEAYDQLAEALKPQKLTPLFREEEGQHIVILLDGVIEPKPSNPMINLVLFVLTLFSMLLAGAIYTYEGPATGSELDIVLGLLRNLKAGIPFGLSLLAILMTHEFGHYLAGRYNKTNVTLPYFIPFPLSPFGTMGAFIQLKEPPKNRRILLDIGIAGPLAGLVVTIPILLIGLSLSSIDIIPKVVSAGESLSIEGNSILYLLAKYVIYGEWLPKPVSYEGVSQVVYWVRYLFTGFPTPFGGQDVFLHPMAWAGWAGLLVTALNLIPAGQLDGGHVLYVLFGEKARRVLPIIMVSLVLLGLAWTGWWIWVFLIFFFGRHHAEPLDQITKLDAGRKFLAAFALVLFVLIFIPVPLRLITGPYLGP
jgi:membrane-associated protease RseP (regulator of RpoE activity)